MKEINKYKKVLIESLPESLEGLIRELSVVAINGGSSQYIFGLDAYTEEDEISREYYKEKGMAVIRGKIEEGKLKEKDIEGLRESYYIHLGALEEMILVGFDLEKEGCPSAMYTRSEKILKRMGEEGYLTESSKEELEKRLEGLRGTKLLNPIKKKGEIEEVAIGVVRLDVSEGGKFEIKFPQKALRMGINQPYMMTPLRGMEILTEELLKVSRVNVLKCKEMSEEGLKERLFTTNELGLYKVYGDSEEGIRKVNKRIKSVEVGYDCRSLRLIVYNVEGSVYGRMHLSIRPEMLSSVEVLKIEEIDKEKHQFDYMRLRRGLIKEIKESREELEGLLEVDYKDCIIEKEKEDKLLRSYLGKKDSELVEILGNERVKRIQEKAELKGEYKDLRKPSNEETLKELLKKNVLRVEVVNSKGQLAEYDITNNEDILRGVLGCDYVKDYESDRKQLEEVLGLLEKGEDINILKLQYKSIGKLGNLESVNAKEKIEGEIERIKNKKKKEKEGVVARRLVPTVTKRGVNFYVTISLENVKSIKGISKEGLIG